MGANGIMGLYNRAQKHRKSIGAMTKKELIKVLDGVFSLHVRMKAADDNGWVTCVTCGARHIWNDGQIDNGHFIPRAREAVRYDERNCHPQCKRCNKHRHGEHDIYRAVLIEKYGNGEVEDLERKARLGGGFDAYQLREMIKECREKNKLLKKEKGL